MTEGECGAGCERYALAGGEGQRLERRDRGVDGV